MKLEELFEQTEGFKRVHIYLKDGTRTTISVDSVLARGVKSKIKDKSLAQWCQDAYNSSGKGSSDAENISRMISQKAIKLIGGKATEGKG